MVSQQPRKRSGSRSMLFSPWNYKVLGAGLLLVVTGFTAMYMENKVDGVISLYISPLLIMAGYVVVIFAIMKHERNHSEQPEQAS